MKDKDLIEELEQLIINNEDDCSGAINKTVFNGINGGNFGTATYPAYNGSLNQSFDMVANLDTVSRDLVGGKKIINNLTLNLRYNGVANMNNVNLYLIQYLYYYYYYYYYYLK